MMMFTNTLVTAHSLSLSRARAVCSRASALRSCYTVLPRSYRRVLFSPQTGRIFDKKSKIALFMGMEVDCTPEDLSKCSYEERCVELGEVKDMRLEAEAVVNDVLFAVTDMHVSHSLSSGLDVAYINVETREGQRYCLELTEAGLRVVGHGFDQVDEGLSSQYHETVYSLLDSLSPGYREAFGNALLQRLERLKQNGQ
uniref:GSKIP domain-containing protein n=3 Tax=Cyprinus carpio TaxID=7962 RepID=A0A8C2KEA7_CYPCA